VALRAGRSARAGALLDGTEGNEPGLRPRPSGNAPGAVTPGIEV